MVMRKLFNIFVVWL